MYNQIVQYGLLVAALGIAVSIVKILWVDFTGWLNSITAKVKNDHLRNVLLAVENAVETAVAQTAQQEYPVLKDAAADGKLSADQAATLKQIAIGRAKSFLTTDMLNVAKANVGDLEALFSGLVEKYVKLGKGGAAQPPQQQ